MGWPYTIADRPSRLAKADLLQHHCLIGQHSGVSSAREATSRDVPAIVPVYLASWRAGYEDLLPTEIIENQMELRRTYDWTEAITSRASAVFVATEQGPVVGVMQATDDVRPEINMLYVAPASWGSRAAPDLLAAGCDWLRSRGHTAAVLRVVEAQARARRFYEREGWTPDPSLAPAHNGFFRLVYYRRNLA